ncbi:MAG: asparaginase [Hyphomicrobiales bacterium]|nr:asparaginase [Hyphomicrobiales bacterium]
MTQRVIVLTTGGTIEHRSKADGVASMDFDPDRLAATIGLPHVDITFTAIMRKGSMDIGPNDWRTIATAVADAIAANFDGIVILHGTDTMHYTAAALSFMLRGLPVPVVMTGSMQPGGDAGSDAIANLRDAVLVAARADFAEVCIVFSKDIERTGGLVIRGTRARKIHSHAINAFASVNVPPIGHIVDGTIHRTSLPVHPRSAGQISLAAAFDTNVVLIKLTPNMTPAMLERFLEGASGAVLEGTGIGHIKTDLQPVVARFGKPTVISTQTPEGGERLGVYEVDQAILAIRNIIPARDMHSDTALVKLMWALAQPGDVAAAMQASIAGEITSTSSG